MIVRSFRRSIFLVGATLALPLIVLVVSTVYFSLEYDRTQIEQQTLENARQIVALTDSRVEADFAAMRILVTTPALTNADWRAAYGRARMVGELNPRWRTVILSDISTGEEIFNIRKPYDGARRAIDPRIQTESRPDRQTVGNATREGLSCPCVYLHLPAPQTNDHKLVLSVALDPLVFQQIMMNHLPAGAVAGVIDRQGNFIARSIDYSDRVGTPATAYVLEAVGKGGEGYYKGRTYEGLENYTAYHSSSLTGWSTHIAADSRLIDRPRFLSSITLLVGTLLALTAAATVSRHVLRDLAQQRHAEAAAVQTQKLEALGRLTGGVAHDFNNLLTVIMGGLSLILRRIEDPKTRGLAANSLEAARRAERLIGQLVTFSRGQSIEIGPVDIRELLTNLATLLKRTIGSRIKLDIRTIGPVQWVTTNADQLELAIVNLAINASDAMPGGGDLIITARIAARDDSLVEIDVKDTGTGMSPEIASKALEPFFTTKPEGEGTGLGLPQVYGIVRQSGGTLAIDSAPGKGTTITLTLPRAEPPAKQTLRIEPSRVANKRRRILVVDDEDSVRRLMASALREAGYTATVANNGKTALEALARSSPDLLLTDYFMADMSGADLTQRAKELQPDLPVLVVSAYAEAASVLEKYPETYLLSKPFTPEKLVEAVGDVFESFVYDTCSRRKDTASSSR